MDRRVIVIMQLFLLLIALSVLLGSTESYQVPWQVKSAFRNLVHPDPAIRRQAAITIGAEPDAVMKDILVRQRLIQTLKDPNPTVRALAAQTLGVYGNIPALGPLIGLLQNDPSSFVRQHCAVSLGIIEQRDAVIWLTQALTDEAPPVRVAAARALGRHRDPWAVTFLICTFDDQPVELRRVAAEALVAIGYPAMKELVLFYNAEKAPFREWTRWTIKKMGDDAVDYLLRLFTTEEKMLVVQSMFILVDLRDAAIPPLIEALGHENSSVAGAASTVLGMIGTEAVDALVKAYEDGDIRTRFGTVMALGNINDDRAAAVVEKASADLSLSVSDLAREIIDRGGQSLNETLEFIMESGTED